MIVEALCTKQDGATAEIGNVLSPDVRASPSQATYYLLPTPNDYQRSRQLSQPKDIRSVLDNEGDCEAYVGSYKA